jgi:hypothetical protein
MKDPVNKAAKKIQKLYSKKREIKLEEVEDIIDEAIKETHEEASRIRREYERDMNLKMFRDAVCGSGYFE